MHDNSANVDLQTLQGFLGAADSVAAHRVPAVQAKRLEQGEGGEMKPEMRPFAITLITLMFIYALFLVASTWIDPVRDLVWGRVIDEYRAEVAK